MSTMATHIVFIGSAGDKRLEIKVQESPAEVEDRLRGGKGAPLPVKFKKSEKDFVYVNAAQIAYFEEARTGTAHFA